MPLIGTLAARAVKIMGQNVTVFDGGWRARASGSALGDSWARAVIATLDAEGGVYLDTLAMWFERFPLTSEKQRWALKTRLESFTTSDHLGAVNELSWYEFMRRANMEVRPILPANAPRPDFKVTAPSEFFVEVSTLNVSDAEKRELQETGGVTLNHAEMLRRLLLKATGEKDAQIAYAASESRPCVLVLFDYMFLSGLPPKDDTFLSGLPPNFYRFLATALLGERLAFAQLPVALSAVVYAKRKISAGHIEISQQQSAIYYNPAARYRLVVGAFELRQFGRDFGEVEPKSQEDWTRL